MAKQRYISTHFWDDSYIINLDPIEKLLYLYLLTNPLTDICGAYEINLRRIGLDTGIDREMVLKILDRFEKANKITYQNGWVLIHNFIKNQASNPSVLAGIARSLNDCPDWVLDRLSQAGISLPQAVLLNLTKPNLTQPAGGAESESEKTEPENTEYRTVPDAPTIPNAEIGVWLDAVAAAVGAKNQKSLRPLERWTDVCTIAVREQRGLDALLAAIKFERNRCGTDVQFFTPEGVLKRVQMAGVTQTRATQNNRPTARQLIAEARAHEEALLQA